MPVEKQPDFKHQHTQLDLWGNKNDSHWKEFKEAKEYVRSLNLKNYDGWEELVGKRKLHGTNIPSNPDNVYKNHGWKNWDDWLGIGGPQKTENKPATGLFDSTPSDDLWSAATVSKWMNFFEARKKVREYGFEYLEEWEMFISGKFPGRDRIPENIPMNPDLVYKHVGWKGWKDWLMDPDQQTEYTEFHKAREFVSSNRIPGKDAWHDFLEGNKNNTSEYQMVLPERPHLEYRDSGWISWEDWLGTKIPYRDFKSTRKFIHSLKLKSRQEWKEFCQGRLTHKPVRTENIFAYPEIAYRDNGWKDWDDWLGNTRTEEVTSTTPEKHEIIIDCKCKGRLENCPVCDGKGYNTRNI